MKAKVRITMKDGRAVTDYRVGYGALQHLLWAKQPYAYSAGLYGWNCDYYDLGDIVICTGYRPVGKAVNYDIVNKYEAKAKKLVENSRFGDYDKCKAKLDKLIEKFIAELEA